MLPPLAQSTRSAEEGISLPSSVERPCGTTPATYLLDEKRRSSGLHGHCVSMRMVMSGHL